MTDQSKTEIICIVDRSGSMDRIKTDMQGGFKRFVDEQRALPGECTFSLYIFDDLYEVVYEGIPAREVPPLTLVPRGSTALLDAVGKTLALAGERLARMPEHTRPGAVVVMIITDGEENASREYTYAAIQSAIEHQRSKYNWQFMFLGAHLRAFSQAQQLGISMKSAGQYSASTTGMNVMYTSSSNAVGSYRSAVLRGATAAVLSLDPDPPQDTQEQADPLASVDLTDAAVRPGTTGLTSS